MSELIHEAESFVPHFEPRPVQPIPVHMHGSPLTSRNVADFGSYRQIVFTGTEAPQELVPFDSMRYRVRVWVSGGTSSAQTFTTMNTPATPATGVAQQNTTNQTYSVAISANGATITNVSVNGITVGTGAGTYVVPAAGSISIAYSVATPIWTWTPTQTNTTVTGVWIGTREQVQAPNGPYGIFLAAGGPNIPIENNQRAWVTPVGASNLNFIVERYEGAPGGFQAVATGGE